MSFRFPRIRSVRTPLRGSLQKTNFDKASISPFCSGSGLKVEVCDAEFDEIGLVGDLVCHSSKLDIIFKITTL